MKAAVLRRLGKPPRFEEFPDPKPSQGEVIVHVKAASLKNIDKMMARGSHDDSHRELPVVCGSDGGKLAIQIAKRLGAGRVVAAGRNEQVLRTLNDLGADATIHLDQSDQELTKAFIREVGHKPFDVIIDYLWGHPTEVLLGALIGHDVKAGASRIRLVEIGEMAGPTIALPAAALRSSGLELYGSGGGSIPHSAIFDAFPQVWALAASGKLSIDTEQAPLADVGNRLATGLTWSQTRRYPVSNCQAGKRFFITNENDSDSGDRDSLKQAA
jgi:NADPH:quinone reductase-like Zn-dependent oxidoreductase